MFIAKDGHHAARTLLWDGQVVHEHPDEDQGQSGRNRPEVADILNVDLFARLIEERCAEESSKAHAEEHGGGQVDERDTEVANAGVDAESKPFLRLREEEADVRHRG